MSRQLTIIQTPAGPVRVTAKGMTVFDALCRTGGDVTLATSYANAQPGTKVSRRQVQRIAYKPGINAMIVAKARDTITKNTARAASKLVSLMDQDDSKKVSLEASKHLLSVSGIAPPQGPGVSVNVGIMSPEGAAWARRTNQTIRTREDREEFERLKEQGAFEGSGPVGYVVDWSPQDDGEAKQVERQSSTEHTGA